MNAQITYLDNSGFLVDTGNHFLIFDYYNNRPARGRQGLAGGAIDPGRIRGKNAAVFVSHVHADHYNPVIFDWKKDIPDIRYVLSDDIRPREGALMAAPNEKYDLGDMKIETVRSTDEGIAFLISVDNFVIYHAGDLNWWHWEGEEAQWNQDMARDYKHEIGKMAGKKIDIAFVPVDPRLGSALLLGIEHFMNTAGATILVPMHYGSAGETAARALDNVNKPESCHIVPPMKRGETLWWSTP